MDNHHKSTQDINPKQLLKSSKVCRIQGVNEITCPVHDAMESEQLLKLRELLAPKEEDVAPKRKRKATAVEGPDWTSRYCGPSSGL